MGRGSSKAGGKTYERLPLSTLMFGGRGASPEDKAKKRSIIKSFMSDVAVGNVYKTGAGIGTPGETFEIVSYNRSPNKMGIKSERGRSVALSTANLEGYLTNGATLLKKNGDKKTAKGSSLRTKYAGDFSKLTTAKINSMSMSDLQKWARKAIVYNVGKPFQPKTEKEALERFDMLIKNQPKTSLRKLIASAKRSSADFR